MSEPLEVIETFTKCDLKAGREEGMGDHSEFIAKSIRNEQYEQVAAMKRAYDKLGIEFPEID